MGHWSSVYILRGKIKPTPNAFFNSRQCYAFDVNNATVIAAGDLHLEVFKIQNFQDDVIQGHIKNWGDTRLSVLRLCAKVRLLSGTGSMQTLWCSVTLTNFRHEASSSTCSPGLFFSQKDVAGCKLLLYKWGSVAIILTSIYIYMHTVAHYDPAVPVKSCKAFDNGVSILQESRIEKMP